MENETRTFNDHDLLIQIDTKVAILVSEMKDLRDNTSVRLAILETGKLDLKEYDRHLKDDYHTGEARLRKVEIRLASWSGALLALQVLGWVLFEFVLRKT